MAGDILIVGGGFAGLEAARVFSLNRKKLGNRRIIVIDPKQTFDFLPVLPAVAASFVAKDHAVLDLRDYLESLKVNFENDEVVRIDTASQEVALKGGGVLSFEFLVLACGTVTNFYGREDIRRRALKLDNADDALVLFNTVSTYPFKRILVVGGGYTGIEIASGIAALLRRRKIKKYSVNIIEKDEDILGPLPGWLKDYCRINLAALRVNIYAGTSISALSDSRLKLACGTEFEDYLLIWAAGVETPTFVRDLDVEKDGQGRLLVDPCLRFSAGCFAAGDAAAFRSKDKTLRMAVQFSLAQGNLVAKNVLRLVAGKQKLIKYRPVDPGLLVPLANKKACGKVLFFNVSGFLGYLLHYLLCIYRSVSAKNKMGIASDFIKRTFSR